MKNITVVQASVMYFVTEPCFETYIYSFLVVVGVFLHDKTYASNLQENVKF